MVNMQKKSRKTGRPPSTGPKLSEHRLTISLDKAQRKLLDRVAMKNRTSAAGVVRLVLRQTFENINGDPEKLVFDAPQPKGKK